MVVYEFLYQVVEASEIIAAEDRNFPEDVLILSCKEDRDFCLPFVNQGNRQCQFYTMKITKKEQLEVN